MITKYFKSNRIYVDGTFEACPMFCYQVFTINTFIQAQQFPLIYGLLPRKLRDIYNLFFRCVKTKAFKCDCYISPVETTSDFEFPLIQSLEFQIPSACIHDCYYHFSVSMEKCTESWTSGRVQRKKTYQEIYTKEWSHYFCAIQFVCAAIKTWNTR